MKKKILFIALLEFLILLNIYGQMPKKELSIKSSINFAFLGTGDFPGFYFNNGIQHQLSKSIHLSGSLGILVSANDGKKDVSITHSDSHIIGDLILILTPINLNKIYVDFNLGGSVRYRSEFDFVSAMYVNGKTTLKFNIDNSFDIGYLGQLDLGFKASNRTSIELILGIHSFNKGTSIFSTGLGIKIKL